jgi:hypothetical protein
MPQAASFCKQIDPVLWRGFCSLNRDRRKIGFYHKYQRALDALLMSGNDKTIFVLRPIDMSYLLTTTDRSKKGGSILGRRKSEWQRMKEL